MRSQPSGADLELISLVMDETGAHVTPTQLERWRMRGLLPRAHVVREGFGGSRVPTHADDVAGAVALLAQISRRSRPWQYSAIELFDAGFSLSTEAVRETATFAVNRSVRPMTKAWARAELEAVPAEDPDEELGEIGERAAALLPRAVWKSVQLETQLAHPHATAGQLREYVDRAMTWRLVDLNVPGRMTDKQRNLARHGSVDPMPVLGATGVLPLPSERLQVARTLSWAEAETYRETARLSLEDNPHADLSTFVVMTWIVTAARRNERPDALDTPCRRSTWFRSSTRSGRRSRVRIPEPTPTPRSDCLTTARRASPFAAGVHATRPVCLAIPSLRHAWPPRHDAVRSENSEAGM